MTRALPRLDDVFQTQADSAIWITKAGEKARLLGGRVGYARWSDARLDALYELAYLRIFSAWEEHLESVFCRALCGYTVCGGQEQLLNGQPYHRTIGAAQVAVLGGAAYKLWQNPATIVKYCKKHFVSPSFQEAVYNANHAQMVTLANIRHRVAHRHNDARLKFDAASKQYAGRTFHKSCAGTFLRASVPATFRASATGALPPGRWLDVVVQDLKSILTQLL